MKVHKITKLLFILLLGSSGITLGMGRRSAYGLHGEPKEPKYHEMRDHRGFRGRYATPAFLGYGAYASDPNEYYDEEYSEDPYNDDLSPRYKHEYSDYR